MTPELDIFYYPEDGLWTDEDGKEIKDIYLFLPPAVVRVILHDELSRSYRTVFFGEEMIINVFYHTVEDTDEY